MVHVEFTDWGQTIEDLRRLSIHAPHARTRERFQALYQIASGAFSAKTWSEHTGRRDETVLGWVHAYNDRGPDALSFRRTGGHAPLLRRPRPKRSSRRCATPSRPPTACPATSGR